MNKGSSLQHAFQTFKLPALILLAGFCVPAKPSFAQTGDTPQAAENPQAEAVISAAGATPAPTAKTAPAESSSTTASLDLPDAPGALLAGGSLQTTAPGQATSPDQAPAPPQISKTAAIERSIFGLNQGDADRASHMASTTSKYILPGQPAPLLTAKGKVEFGFIHGISAYGVLGWFVSSGYSHIINTSPNYGTDKGAYGERLGAAALRGYSTEVFKDSLMANVFRQDPRYYKMGPRHSLIARTAYSASRIFVTRNDDGNLVPNYSLISGNLLGAALTNAYYPDVNRGFGQTARTFGSAMYGTAFSFFASEFIGGAFEALHIGEGK